MEEKNSGMRELNLDEMNKISGGARYGGTPDQPEKQDLEADEMAYQIRPGDTLRMIALKFNTTREWLLSRNGSIEGPNYDLMAYYWIRVPKR